MDFVTRLPHTSRGYDNIWVTVDWLTKSTHFLWTYSTFNAKWLARILHSGSSPVGVPVFVISN